MQTQIQCNFLLVASSLFSHFKFRQFNSWNFETNLNPYMEITFPQILKTRGVLHTNLGETLPCIQYPEDLFQDIWIHLIIQISPYLEFISKCIYFFYNINDTVILLPDHTRVNTKTVWRDHFCFFKCSKRTTRQQKNICNKIPLIIFKSKVSLLNLFASNIIWIKPNLFDGCFLSLFLIKYIFDFSYIGFSNQLISLLFLIEKLYLQHLLVVKN